MAGKLRPFLIIILLVLLNAYIMVACKSQPTGETTETTLAGSKPVLRVWMMGFPYYPSVVSEGLRKGFQELLGVFEERENCIINYQDIGWTSPLPKILTSMQGNSGPDVYMLGSTWVGDVAGKGTLLNLDPYIENNPKAQISDFYDRYMEMAKVKGYGKDAGLHYYAWPIFIDTRHLFYDKIIFKQWREYYKEKTANSASPINLKDPWSEMTWDEFKMLAVYTTGKNPVTGRINYGYPLKGQDDSVFQFMNFLYANSGTFYNEAGDDSALNTDQAIEAIEYYISFCSPVIFNDFPEKKAELLEQGFDISNGVCNPGAAANSLWTLNPEFSDPKNQYAMHESLPDLVPQAAQKDPLRVGVLANPVRVKGDATNTGGLLGGCFLSINKVSKLKDLAAKFLFFIGSSEAQQWIFQYMTKTSPRKEAKNWDLVANSPDWKQVYLQLDRSFDTPITSWETSYQFVRKELQNGIIGANKAKTKDEIHALAVKCSNAMHADIHAFLKKVTAKPTDETFATVIVYSILGTFLLLLIIFITIDAKRQSSLHSKSILTEFKRGLIWYALMIPIFLLLFSFLIYPFFESLRISFLKSDGLNIEGSVGFTNYNYLFENFFRNLFNGRGFPYAIWNTFSLIMFIMVFGLPFALVLAVLINERIFFKSAFKVIYFLPVVTVYIAITIVWSMILKPGPDGAINSVAINFFQFFGIDNIGTLKWFAAPGEIWNFGNAKWGIIIMDIWKGIGFWMIVFLAGLQGIPETLYEAAMIDGANIVQRFFRITVPMLRSTITFLVITGFIGGLQMFDQIFAVNGDPSGNPNGSIQTMVAYLYQQAFANSDFGIASAAAYVLFIIIAIVTLFNLRLLRPTANS